MLRLPQISWNSDRILTEFWSEKIRLIRSLANGSSFNAAWCGWAYRTCAAARPAPWPPSAARTCGVWAIRGKHVLLNFAFCQMLSKFCQEFRQILAKFSWFFASNITFFSIFQNLQVSVKFCEKFCKILRISEKFAKFCKICQKCQKFLQFIAIFGRN